MGSFLKDYEEFRGTGQVNEQGESLETFLEKYDPYQYKNPCVTVDVVVLKEDSQVKNMGCKLLMIQRRNHPCIGMWALPGGFTEIHEDLIASAKRELLEETGLKDIAMEQLYTWGDEKRDPRARIITVSYLAYLMEELIVNPGDDAKDAVWMDINLELKETLIDDGKAVRRQNQIYEVTLSNDEKKITLSSLIEVGQNVNTRLKEKSYRVIKNQGIGFDHARVIVQALLAL